MTRLIALNGFQRSGKDTVATMIAANYHYDGLVVERRAFAAKLKIAAAATLGFHGLTAEQAVALMDECKASWRILVNTPLGDSAFDGRDFLRWFGTEACRDTFGYDFWVDQVLPNPALQEGWSDNEGPEALNRGYLGVDLLLITDCRFANEASRVLQLGGEVWEVQRPGVGGADHASEVALPLGLVTKVINNDGTLAELAEKVRAAL